MRPKKNAQAAAHARYVAALKAVKPLARALERALNGPGGLTEHGAFPVVAGDEWWCELADAASVLARANRVVSLRAMREAQRSLGDDE